MRCLRKLASLTMIAVLLAGCDSLFEVENPTDIQADDLDNPQMTSALANSPMIALSDVYDFAVILGGMPGDGIVHVSNNEGWLRPDRGTAFDFNTEDAEALYNELAAAQWTAQRTTAKLRSLIDDPGSDARVARGHFWDGLARVTQADLFERITFDAGPAHPPSEVYRIAIDTLELAASIGRAAGDLQVVAAAEATIARAYRSLYYDYTSSQDPELFEQARTHALAALDARSRFALHAHYQPPGSQNGVFDGLYNSNYNVMDPVMANLEDPVSGQRDPRVQHTQQHGVGTRGGTPIYWQTKYPALASDIPVSRWQEPVLILAEYHVLNGNLSQAVERINEVREAAELPAFSSGDADEIMSQLQYERKAEFWLEMRRWQDMRYYDIVPDSWTAVAKQEGVDRRFPISIRECTANTNVDCP